MSITVSSLRVVASNLHTNGTGEQIKAIPGLKSKRLLETELGLDGLFDYFIPDSVREFLTGYEMELSVHSFQGHAHPISEIIEKRMLCRVAPYYFSSRVLIVSCNKNLYFEQYNRLVRAKDHHRYKNAVRDLDVGSLTGFVNLEQTCECLFIKKATHYGEVD